MSQVHVIRIRWLFAIIALTVVVVLFRLYHVQIVLGAEYRNDAEKQYVATVPNIYNRGTIYFHDKSGKLVSAATLKTGYIVAINPKLIVDADALYAKLSAITPLDKSEFLAKAAKKDDPYEEVARRVEENAAEAIKKLKIESVQTFRERWRYYPNGSLAAQTVGLVGYQDDTLAGRYGIERHYNDTLSRNAEDLYVNFFADMFLNLGGTVFDKNKDVGTEGDIVLTIEPTVEAQLEGALAGISHKWRSESSGGIIMDPRDGKIYAMATNPTFDPNDLSDVKDVGVLSNPLVERIYEMGSTIKPLTMAAGIDVVAVRAESTYNDTGSMTLNKKTFSNYDGKARGPGTSMQEVLNQSLNTGVAFVVSRMGNGVFREYMREKYHIGDETGVDLPNETQGIVSNLESTRDIEYATASFGQGIAMTPINVTTALSALANGGKLVSPYIVDEIRYTNGRMKKTVPNPPEQILKKSTSDEITRMLVTVVDKALLHGEAKLPNYAVAAKTGTAQIARSREAGGGYYDDRYMHTFFGYFPAYDPQFLVFLYTFVPKEAKFASETLTPPFMDLAKFLLNYYNVPPDRGPNVVTLPQGT